MNTLEVTEKDFLARPKTYLDLSDSGTHVVLRYGVKAYAIVPDVAADSNDNTLGIADDYDRYFNSEMLARIDKSLQQANNGEVITVKGKEELHRFLDAL
jgi:hypothetical protein